MMMMAVKMMIMIIGDDDDDDDILLLTGNITVIDKIHQLLKRCYSFDNNLFFLDLK